MSSEKHISCGPCRYDDVTKDATRWCTNCEEGLCEDCEHVHRKSKSSRNHNVISTEDYTKIENLSISQVCEHHDENLEWFCKTHDKALCVVCVPSNHKSCSDVIPISFASSNARQSTALFDLEDAIERTLLNLKRCIKNRESATKENEKQELTVKNMILETRTKINLHLDRLQEKLLCKLESTTDTCKSKYRKFLQKLESTEEMLTKLREQTLHMKQFSSDIQVFLGTRQVNRQIVRETKFIKDEIDDFKDYEFTVSMHSLIENLVNEVEEFGQIKVTECAARLNFEDPKIDHAQIGINVPTSKNISDIKLQLTKTFQIQKKNEIDIRSCVKLPNGHLLMANFTKENNLIEYSDKGKHVRDIQVSDKPNDIAVIDLDRIVVTYGDALFLEIMNNKTFNVEMKVNLQRSCLAVSHTNGRLYVANGSEIQVLDLTGKQLETLKAVKGVAYIKTSGDKIFYADYDKYKVHCCHLNGEVLWELNSDSIIFPNGVTVDDYHNVYVVGYISNNLTIIQPDGRDSKTLLTKSDGLLKPQAVYYDKDKNILLICNKEGKVALYKVV